MKMVLQRVSRAEIVINNQPAIPIKQGMVSLVGFTEGDDEKTVDFMLGKMLNLRIFDDEDGNLNLALGEVNGELMVVSNFTLYAGCKKGRRPSFVKALHPDFSIPLYNYMIESLEKFDGLKLVTGEFGADMQVSLCNDGPVTIILDSEEIMPAKE